MIEIRKFAWILPQIPIMLQQKVWQTVHQFQADHVHKWTKLFNDGFRPARYLSLKETQIYQSVSTLEGGVTGEVSTVREVSL
ncbi:hypothetical protein [Holospora curviuscula]|uniref:Uncharacterized protein n=1 Tax=Holospora curviuscula TaxID=1082868 RepID=A0A2S5R8S1_9PROT|nr:hypothetical protein [Holospora curviuscula]PPE03683.1 hypothetical protein HCUR_00913 [Holospora curviuscula]